jgi:acyl-ACP thioesterase
VTEVSDPERREAGEEAAGQALPGPPGHDERAFVEIRRVRLAEAGGTGELRLDGLARYLQDVADADAADAGILTDAGRWVLRAGQLRVRRWPALRELVRATTWCSGTGACWAQRRTSLVDEAGAALAETVTTWVHVDPVQGRPRRVPAGMAAVYGGRALTRRVEARLRLPAEAPRSAHRRAWPLRRADLDVMGHVNNAAALAPLVEALGEHGLNGAMTIDLEHRGPLSLTPAPTLATAAGPGGDLHAWLFQGGNATLAARVDPHRG